MLVWLCLRKTTTTSMRVIFVTLFVVGSISKDSSAGGCWEIELLLFEEDSVERQREERKDRGVEVGVKAVVGEGDGWQT